MDKVTYLTCIRFSFQLLLAELFFLYDYPKQEHFFRRIFCSSVVYATITGLLFYLLKYMIPPNEVLDIAFWLGLFFLTMGGIYFCYDLTFTELLFIGISGYALQHIAFLIAEIIKYIFHIHPESISVFWDNLIFRILIYIAVDIIVYCTIIRKNQNKLEIKDKDIRMIIIMFATLTSTIILSSLSGSSRFNPNGNLIIYQLYSLLCASLIIYIEYYLFRENRLKHDNEIMEQLFQLSDVQMRTSKEAIDIINIKCHDLKYQMRMLENLDDKNDRKEYIDELKNAVSIYDATYQTGNDALDYILREKTLLCNEYQIAFSCIADGTLLSFMQSPDTYALIGNALDNAIECVKKEAPGIRIISLKISRFHNMVSIHLENTCTQPPQFQDGIPLTTKGDTAHHGFGVRSIRSIVTKYSGQMRMKAENHKFYLDLLFSSVGE